MAKESPSVLLARIDERQKQYSIELASHKRETTQQFTELKKEVQSLRTDRDKARGALAAMAVVGGIIGGIVSMIFG